MNDTLDKLSALTGIQLPQEDYSEKPGINNLSTAQIADAMKSDSMKENG